MAGQGTCGEGRLPFAELIIRPGDERPVIIRLCEMGGSVDISTGSSEDMVTAHVILSLMAATARSLGIVRQMVEGFETVRDNVASEGDDLPF